jgi:hypothetical protein
MKNRSKIRFFQFFLLVCMIFFVASVAQAGSSHQHHHGNTDVVSPFDKINKGAPLHCVLNLHLENGSAHCPHKNQDDNYYEFRPDCGTHSGSANSSGNSLAKSSSQMTFYYETLPALSSWQLGLVPNEKLQKLPRFIDHPPQLT